MAALLAGCSAGKAGGPLLPTDGQTTGSPGAVLRAAAQGRLLVSIAAAASPVASLAIHAVAPGSEPVVFTVDTRGAGCCRAVERLSPGTYVASVTSYANTGGRGPVLARGQWLTFVVPPVRAGVLRLGVGSPGTSYAFAALSPSVIDAGSQHFTIGPRDAWGKPVQFAIEILDASRNVLVGPSLPKFSLRALNSSFKLFALSDLDGNSFTVNPPRGERTASTFVRTQLQLPGPACIRRACSASMQLTYAPFAQDDWITFAHDFKRSAVQSQETGIDVSTVASLRERWHTDLGLVIIASPLAYAGNVIVTTIEGTVFDLSAADGHVIWKRSLPEAAKYYAFGMYATPTIDTDDGFVLVGDRELPKDRTSPNGISLGPSHLWALRVSDGTIAWKTVVPLQVRSGPVYANGTIYLGLSGGDAPWCENGGVTALNAKTAERYWTWYVNPFTNPGGGGAVWGPISYDGSHLYFGTGNACAYGIKTQQGAVSLNLDGTMRWGYSAEADGAEDDDTGGAVLLNAGTATFMNKNGTVYHLDATTGRRIWSTALGAANSYGGFSSPGTDGSTYVVGAGYLEDTDAAERTSDFCALSWARSRRPNSSGYHSAIVDIDAAGQVRWSILTPFVNASYIAVSGGVAYVALFNRMSAIDVDSGRPFWQLQGVGGFAGGAVVVPSGIYAADDKGHVYAASLR